jgi:hypothetical protein
MTPAQRTHRRIAGGCMILAPLLLLVSAILQPSLKSNEVQQLVIVANNLDRWFATQAFALGAIALSIPVVLGLMHMLREKQTVAGNVGGGFALLGLLASTGTVTIALVAWQMMRFGLPIPVTAAVLHDAKHVAGLEIPFVILPFAFAVGFVVLAVGIGAAHLVNAGMAAAIAVGAVIVPIAYVVASDALLIIGAAILLIGLATTGLVVLRESDADWEHPPEFRGFRPAAGTH